VSGGITLLNLPIAFALLKAGYSPVSVHGIGIGLSFCALAARIMILSRQLDFSIWRYIKSVIFPVAATIGISSIIPSYFVFLCSPGISRLFLTVTISVLSVAVAAFFLGTTGMERKLITGKIRAWFPKIKDCS
jgi:hypothetical protein